MGAVNREALEGLDVSLCVESSLSIALNGEDYSPSGIRSPRVLEALAGSVEGLTLKGVFGHQP